MSDSRSFCCFCTTSTFINVHSTHSALCDVYLSSPVYPNSSKDIMANPPSLPNLVHLHDMRITSSSPSMSICGHLSPRRACMRWYQPFLILSSTLVLQLRLGRMKRCQVSFLPTHNIIIICAISFLTMQSLYLINDRGPIGRMQAHEFGPRQGHRRWGR